MSQQFNAMIDAALARLSKRAHYAADVITGRQAWSGSDLKGKAKQYSAGYSFQRSVAKSALLASGGDVIPIETGALTTALYVGMNDFGDAIYETQFGAYIADRKRCRPTVAS